MPGSFKDKRVEKDCNHPHLYDVSLPMHSDKHAHENSARKRV